MTRFILALITALALAVPAKAQFEDNVAVPARGPYSFLPGVLDWTLYERHAYLRGDTPPVMIGLSDNGYPWLRGGAFILFNRWRFDGPHYPHAGKYHPHDVLTFGIRQVYYVVRDDMLVVHFSYQWRNGREFNGGGDNLDFGYAIFHSQDYYHHSETPTLQRWHSGPYFPQDALREKEWEAFVARAYLTVGADTFYVKDALHGETIEQCGDLRAEDGYSACWKAGRPVLQTLTWSEPFVLHSPIYAQPELWAEIRPGAGEGEIRIDFTVPYMSGRPDDYQFSLSERSLYMEKHTGMVYQYALNGQWHNIPIEEAVHTTFGPGDWPGRAYFITGLDPTETYTVCFRVKNDYFDYFEVPPTPFIRHLDYGSSSRPTLPVCAPSPIRAVSAEREQPKTVALRPNYPNPFNPSTAIEYELATPQHVRLDVFDATGRTVKVLANGIRPVGTHTVTFDAYSLPSGLYVYRLQAGGKTITRKMTLVK